MSITPAQALRAIISRLEGRFDNPDLVAFGPLSDTTSDILSFARIGLGEAPAPAEGPIEARPASDYRDYRVDWSIDVYAASPEHAARQALAIQQSADRTLSGTFVAVAEDDAEPTVVDLFKTAEDEAELDPASP